MAVRKVKPTSPGRRFQDYATFDEITRSRPEKSLLRALKKSGGRNAFQSILEGVVILTYVFKSLHYLKTSIDYILMIFFTV